MPDYQNSKIYRIVCNITGDTYYGSTTQPLCNRKLKHKNPISRCVSKQIIERGNWSIVLVESFPCNGKEELLMKERYYIEHNECINLCKRPIISEKEKKEYRHQNYSENREIQLAQMKARREGEQRDEILAKKREYHHNNKEKIAEKAKEYRESNKEKVAARKKVAWARDKEKYKEQRAKYREDNKEAKILQDKEYYAKNKDKVVTCECGLELKKWSLSRHKKTQQHLNLLAQNCEE